MDLELIGLQTLEKKWDLHQLLYRILEKNIEVGEAADQRESPMTLGISATVFDILPAAIWTPAIRRVQSSIGILKH